MPPRVVSGISYSFPQLSQSQGQVTHVLLTDPTFDSSFLTVMPLASGVTDFHDLTGGVYKARERIHRSVADLRLLATPTS